MTAIAFPTARNLLPLARYAQLMRLDLAHVFQVNGTSYPLAAACKTCWTDEMRWILRSTIAEAERMMAQHLMFPVAPAYCIDRHTFPARWRMSSISLRAFRYQFGMNGWPDLRTRWHKVLTLGSIELQEIAPDSFVWSCPDENGVNALATITIADAAAAYDINRLRVFHDNPTYLGVFPDMRVEVRGLRFRRVGDDILIDGDRGLWVIPDTCAPNECVEWNDDESFAATLDDLHVYEEIDHIEDAVCYEWTRTESGASCATTTQRGCPVIYDDNLGILKSRPGSWDGATLSIGTPTYCYPPNRYLVRYRAGWIDEGAYVLDYTGHQHSVDPIGPEMADAIVRLTNSLLPDDVRCGCAHAQQRWKFDRELVGYSTAQGSSSYSRPSLGESDRCPFGPTYGALQAWRVVRRHMSAEAFVG